MLKKLTRAAYKPRATAQAVTSLKERRTAKAINKARMAAPPKQQKAAIDEAREIQLSQPEATSNPT